jgi:hypothetical protein
LRTAFTPLTSSCFGSAAPAPLPANSTAGNPAADFDTSELSAKPLIAPTPMSRRRSSRSLITVDGPSRATSGHSPYFSHCTCCSGVYLFSSPGMPANVTASTDAAMHQTASLKMLPPPSRFIRAYIATPAIANVAPNSGQKIWLARPRTALSIADLFSW